ncbi:MAG: YcaO-like family protein [Pseudomonadota bacterium]
MDAAVPDGDKGFRAGTRRACPPARTWARIAPLLPVFGITRLANLTGLDRVGIPVFQACRPNARSLSVYQGKGADPMAARVSAAMEAIETHCAERVVAPVLHARFEDIRHDRAVVEIDTLPHAEPQGLDPWQPILWIEGGDLIGGGRRWLPFELVHADYALPEPPNSGVLAATTNGLASGNTRDEALLHALLEVIERDAETLWKLGPDGWGSARAVDLATVDCPHCRALLDRFAAAGLRVAAWDIASDLGVPAFTVLVDDPAGETGAPEVGAGAHLAPEVALSRALTEAAQARLTFIAGAREDIEAGEYAPDVLADRRAEAAAIIDALTPARAFRATPSIETETLAGDIETVLGRLAAAGIEQAMAVDLTMPSFAIPVMRVVVPGLEGALEGPEADYVPGPRARALL